MREGRVSHGASHQKAPLARNIYGENEFIVKLQPPVGGGLSESPWMCYDGPSRSFQAYVPALTQGLTDVYALLQSDGIKSFNPTTGQSGYKGYFKARWEGSCVRVYYDSLAPPQTW
jgi:hypothetical protein